MSSLIRLPALQALLIQLAACGVVLIIAALVSRLQATEISLLTAVILQACVASALAWWRGVERWWRWIHLLFVPCVLLLLALRLPSWIYLLLFTCMLVLYWQTFRTRVPFYPSPVAVQEAVAKLLPAHALQFVDIGSGFGGLVCALAGRRPDAGFTGVELAPLPWLVSVLRARWRLRNVRFLRSDYVQLDLSRFDVVFAYLSPAAMPALWAQAQAQMVPGSLLLSYEFEIAAAPPPAIELPQGEGRGPLYGWRF